MIKAGHSGKAAVGLVEQDSKDRRQTTMTPESASLIDVSPTRVVVEKPARSRSAVLKYPGAKWTIAHLIVDQFTEHYHYVEPFFGSGAVFFSKAPSGHELINDSHGLVVNLFRVLRDQTEELCWALETTPWSRAEYDESHIVTGDSLEDARRFVVRCWQAHASDLAKKTGWKSRGARQSAGGMSLRWKKVPAQLRELAWRLTDAEIENRPASEVIKRHSAENCLIYADPPYVPSTRTQFMYGAEMTLAEHFELVEALLKHSGPVVISGYANELYDDAFKDWSRLEIKAPKVEKGSARTEVLWVKPVAAPSRRVTVDHRATGRESTQPLSS